MYDNNNTKGRHSNFDDIVERIRVLRKQETGYSCVDYLSLEYQARQSGSRASQSPLPQATQADNRATSMTVAWRDKICEWYYTIADYFNYEREIVYICMNNLDRYAMRHSVDTRSYQLAAIASLFIVVKMYETSTSNRRIDATSLSKLSQNVFDESSIIAMESEMLHTLRWHLHPPTSYTFVQTLSSLLFSLIEESNHNKLCPSAKHEIKELSRFLTELSVCDYFFVTHNSSTVGLASLLNAIDLTFEKVEYCHELPHELMHTCADRVFYFTGLSVFSPEVQECRSRLRETYVQGGFYQGQVQESPEQGSSGNMDNDGIHECPKEVLKGKTEDTDNTSESTPTDAAEAKVIGCAPSPVCVSNATE